MFHFWRYIFIEQSILYKQDFIYLNVFCHFLDHMNVDGEDEISHEDHLKHFLVYFVILF